MYQPASLALLVFPHGPKRAEQRRQAGQDAQDARITRIPGWTGQQHGRPVFGLRWLLLHLQGCLALGSAEARRVARPVSGLRCSGTLIDRTDMVITMAHGP
jgi:hypothetical protein